MAVKFANEYSDLNAPNLNLGRKCLISDSSGKSRVLDKLGYRHGVKVLSK